MNVPIGATTCSPHHNLPGIELFTALQTATKYPKGVRKITAYSVVTAITPLIVLYECPLPSSEQMSEALVLINNTVGYAKLSTAHEKFEETVLVTRECHIDMLPKSGCWLQYLLHKAHALSACEVCAALCALEKKMCR
jgi:hypothetical protein